MKKVLTEQQLSQIVYESAMRILNEKVGVVNEINGTAKLIHELKRLCSGKSIGRGMKEALSNLATMLEHGGMSYEKGVFEIGNLFASAPAEEVTAVAKNSGLLGKILTKFKSGAGAVKTGVSGGLKAAGSVISSNPVGAMAVAAVVVATGTMIFLNRRNKKGLEALKQGKWDGNYPWANQEIVDNGPKKSTQGGGVSTAQTGTQGGGVSTAQTGTQGGGVSTAQTGTQGTSVQTKDRFKQMYGDFGVPLSVKPNTKMNHGAQVLNPSSIITK